MIGVGLIALAVALAAAAKVRPAPVVLVDARTVVQVDARTLLITAARHGADVPVRDHGETPMLAPAAMRRALSRYRAQALTGAGTPHRLRAVC